MSTPTLLIPLRTPIHTSTNACNNTTLRLPPFCPPHNLRVYAHATNTDDPNPMQSAIDVLLNSTPIQDAGLRRYVLLNGLSFPQIGRWRVQLYGKDYWSKEELALLEDK